MGGRDSDLLKENEALRAKLSAAIQERAAMVRFLDTPALAITHMARSGEILYINQAGARNLGGKPADFIGKKVTDLLPANAAAARERIDRTLATGEPVQAETLVKLPAGARWFRSTYIPVVGPSGKPEEIQLFSQDITEVRQMEAALESSEGRLAAIVEHAPHVVAMLDCDGVVRYINRAPSGYSVNDLIGVNPAERVPAPHGEHLRKALRDVTETNSAQLIELEDLFGQHWEVRLAPIRRGGQVQQIVAFGVDVSERFAARDRERQLEAQVQHGQKLESLGVLAGGIAHDFNNLLVGILGNADLARRREDASPTRAYLDDIVHAAQRAAELCRQMLAYAGQAQPELSSVDLTGLARDTVELLPMVSGRALLTCELAPNLPPTRADATQLRQVVMNLLTNAAEATLGGGPANERKIVLRSGEMECDARYLVECSADESTKPGRYVYVEVEDTGCGMEPEARSRMFDPFFSTKQGGSGLGLSAVLGIVRRHDGAIHVTTRPQHGTTIRVVLPVAPRAVEAPVEGDTHCAPLSPAAILVVDDEPTVRQVARRILEAHGHRVTVAEDGVHALEVYAAHKGAFDAVLLDVSMPRLGGLEVLADLREQNPRLPIVLASGFAENEEASRSNDAITTFIGKPYDIRSLLEALHRVAGTLS